MTARTETAPKLIIKANPQAAAREAARIFIHTARISLETSDTFSVLLSGGKTPELLLQLLADPPDRERLDWKRLFIFWGDERIVPATSAESNYRMAKEALLDHIPIPVQNIYRVPTELQSPELIAHAYEATVRDFFQISLGTPHFDFAFLGLGSDGHTASLFPDSDYIALSADNERLVISPFVIHLQQHRISVTLRVLNSAKHLLLLVTGQEKAQALQAALQPQPNDQLRPVTQTLTGNRDVTWITDTAGAALLKKPLNSKDHK